MKKYEYKVSVYSNRNYAPDDIPAVILNALERSYENVKVVPIREYDNHELDMDLIKQYGPLPQDDDKYGGD